MEHPPESDAARSELTAPPAAKSSARLRPAERTSDGAASRRGPDLVGLIGSAPLIWLALGQSSGAGQALLIGLGVVALSMPRIWRLRRHR